MTRYTRRPLIWLGVVVALVFFLAPRLLAAEAIPGINISIGGEDGDLGQSIPLLVLLTVLTLVPSILVLTTSFTRIVIVLGFTRNAMGTQNMPPNQVITGLALILTFFLMSPTLTLVYETAWQPYSAGTIELDEALSRAEIPVKDFMLRQTYDDDVMLFANFAQVDLSEVTASAEVPFRIALPAFIISELKTAFIMGFMIYIPFLIIDMVVASTLMSMGMMMLPPVMISLPFKVMLFTLVNGWHLVVDSILRSFLQ